MMTPAQVVETSLTTKDDSLPQEHWPERSNYTITCYPHIQTIHCTEFLLTIYPYNIKKTSDENKEKDNLGDYWFIQYQILGTNIIRIE